MNSVDVLRKTANVYTGDVITTFLLTGFPWRLLCELNTHRQVSKNCESSRARPTASVIEQVRNNPYVPVWTESQKGMQGREVDSCLSDVLTEKWLAHRNSAVAMAKEAMELGLHKQDCNSYLHPWMRVSVICTATHEEWMNVFRLRCDAGAKKCFQWWANEMVRAYEAAEVVVSDRHDVYEGMSVMAQCARIGSVSYAKHAEDRTEEQWLGLAERLIGMNPVHISPFQHVSFAVGKDSELEIGGLDTMFALDYHNHDCLHDFFREIYHNNTKVANTANFRGWVNVASLVEAFDGERELLLTSSFVLRI